MTDEAVGHACRSLGWQTLFCSINNIQSLNCDIHTIESCNKELCKLASKSVTLVRITRHSSRDAYYSVAGID
jgi:hypothetical protein